MVLSTSLWYAKLFIGKKKKIKWLIKDQNVMARRLDWSISKQYSYV